MNFSCLAFLPPFGSTAHGGNGQERAVELRRLPARPNHHQPARKREVPNLRLSTAVNVVDDVRTHALQARQHADMSHVPTTLHLAPIRKLLRYPHETNEKMKTRFEIDLLGIRA